MRALPTGKNITVHFTEDELCLLEAFDRLRKSEYSTRSSWIKNKFYKALPETFQENMAILS